jgi:hypothetical protein
MKKTGRNDPCPCGSGKKFKKCCEDSMIGGRFKAAKVDVSSAPKIASASRLTGLFKTQMANIATPSEDSQLIKPMQGVTKGNIESSENPSPSLETPVVEKEGLEQKHDI